MERAAVDRQARAATLQDELNATAEEIGAGGKDRRGRAVQELGCGHFGCSRRLRP